MMVRSLTTYICLLATLLASPSFAAIHFYLNPGETKCFYEDLARGSLLLIKYKLEVSINGDVYLDSNKGDTDIFFTVEELFDRNHLVASQRGSYQDFLFNAFDGGEHKICLRPQTSQGYKLNQKARVTIDIDTGDKSILDKGEAAGEEIQHKIQKLSKALRYLKNEYKVFRHKEAVFRDLSEDVNGGAVKWVIFQFIVLSGICYFQLKTLKTFFIKQKVV